MDFCVRVPSLPQRGETILASSVSRSLGGKGANQATALRRLGGEVAIVTCVGDDDFGAVRDATGHEVDVLIDQGATLVPLEIKAGETVANNFFDGLKFFRKLAGDPNGPAALVYGGDRTFEQFEVKVYSWQVL